MLGLLDEPAHLATAALIRRDLPFLVGSVLPDLDHVPYALAPVHPNPGDPRPRTHTLALSAAVALVSPAAAAGTLAHFARDLADGSGVPLLWPLSDRELRVPYPLYAGALAALTWRR